MSDFVRSYLTVAIFGALAGVLVAAFLSLGKALRPNRPSPQKYLTYESGVDPFGDLWSQSNIRYYVFALLFVLFDVEAVFIFPWATRLDDVKDAAGTVVARGYGVFGLVEMGVFIVILLLGLVYAWRKGMLRWV
jgi:NADH-quinone oxidoreductase subunit A